MWIVTRIFERRRRNSSNFLLGLLRVTSKRVTHFKLWRIWRVGQLVNSFELFNFLLLLFCFLLMLLHKSLYLILMLLKHCVIWLVHMLQLNWQRMTWLQLSNSLFAHLFVVGKSCDLILEWLDDEFSIRIVLINHIILIVCSQIRNNFFLFCFFVNATFQFVCLIKLILGIWINLLLKATNGERIITINIIMRLWFVPPLNNKIILSILIFFNFLVTSIVSNLKLICRIWLDNMLFF